MSTTINGASADAPLEITVFTKSGGPLSKRISLNGDGTVKSDGSACVMMRGRARRAHLAGVHDLAALIERLESNEAIALGRLRPDLADDVSIITKNKLNTVNGHDIIARTGNDIVYRADDPAFVLLDYDMKGMPRDVADRIAAHGGFWNALCWVVPEFVNAARVIRKSTSAGLKHTETGQEFPGSGGLHAFIIAKRGDDVERFLTTLHERCWLSGLGWMMVGVAGQFLERSIVDRMVGMPERLVFEGPPLVEPPLAQDAIARRPEATDGEAIDTLHACPPLTLVEKQALRKLKAEARQLLSPEMNKAREAYVAERARDLAARTNMSEEAAARVVEKQCNGVLLADVALPFDALDDEEYRGRTITVGDVLDNPAAFEGMTLADPIEGVDYGRCKAKVMRGADGAPWIHSFAHGRTTFKLKYDADAVRIRIERAHDPINALVKLALSADLDEVETKQFIDQVARRASVGVTAVKAKLESAKNEQACRRAAEMHERRLAERTDPRPQIARPDKDAPFLPQMETLGEVLGKSTADQPPARDIDGVIARACKIKIPNTHAFTANDANTEHEEEEEKRNRLPPPEQWVIVRMNEMELAEEIERHIDYVDENGRSVRLPSDFVKHYLQRRDDDVLPSRVAVSPLPLVLATGELLAPEGLDRLRGIEFVIPKELREVIPSPEDCTPEAVAREMKFLCDNWLVDVNTDLAGKCTLIAAALTMMERSLLDERPCFFVSAARRGGGKTTALTMLILAVTGIRPAAAAWSLDENERRKALLAYFMLNVPYILWDNIPRGFQIDCPHIEKSCTTKFYQDRRLGVSEVIATSASTIHFFTGNNIEPRGDLSSRSLRVEIEVDRPDPENRPFTHPDIIGWTNDHRAEILRALYTIMLGNPTLKKPSDAQMKTRFPTWWRLVGSAVEHAAEQAGMKTEVDEGEGELIDFKKLFLEQEEKDENDASLAMVLTGMRRKWGVSTFKASDVATVINFGQYDDAGFGGDIQEFLLLPPNVPATPKSVGKRLKSYVGEPVRCGDETLALRTMKEDHQKVYYVAKIEK
jgi:hypothetical protein